MLSYWPSSSWTDGHNLILRRLHCCCPGSVGSAVLPLFCWPVFVHVVVALRHASSFGATSSYEVSGNVLRWLEPIICCCVVVPVHDTSNVVVFSDNTHNAIDSVFSLRTSELFCYTLSLAFVNSVAPFVEWFFVGRAYIRTVDLLVW